LEILQGPRQCQSGCCELVPATRGIKVSAVRQIQEYFPQPGCRLTLSAAGCNDAVAGCELRLPFSTLSTIGRTSGEPGCHHHRAWARPPRWHLEEGLCLENTFDGFSCLADAPYLAYGPLPSLAPTSETPVSLTCLEADNGLLPESAAAISQGSHTMALIREAPASDAAIFRTKGQHQDRVTGRAATRQRAKRVRCLQKN
jgi:hypothetical protein